MIYCIDKTHSPTHVSVLDPEIPFVVEVSLDGVVWNGVTVYRKDNGYAYPPGVEIPPETDVFFTKCWPCMRIRPEPTCQPEADLPIVLG